MSDALWPTNAWVGALPRSRSETSSTETAIAKPLCELRQLLSTVSHI